MLPAEQQTAPVAAFFGLTRLGREAVLVFFALSGFLVFGQVIRRLRSDRFDLISYSIDRVTRIFLPLVPAVLLTAALSWLLFRETPAMTQIALNAIGLNGVLAQTLHLNAPLWTLAYEIWFYVVGGAAGYVLWARGQHKLAALMVLALGLAVFCVLDARYLAFWMLGGMMIYLLDAPRRGTLAVLGVALAVSGVALYQLTTGSKSFISIDQISPEVAEFLICLGVILAIPFLCDEHINASLRLLARPAHFLGSISFSLYLFHYPINSCLDQILAKSPTLDPQGWLDFFLRLLICGLVAIVAWFAFERNTPILRTHLRRLVVPGTQGNLVN